MLLAQVPDRHRVGVFGLCVFSIPRVFYHCPTTSATPVSKNTCRPGRKSFHLQNHDRPCRDHRAVRATPDCVHRVTVLCLCPVAYMRPPGCAINLCCVTLPRLCHRVPLGCAHPLLCPLCCALDVLCLFPPCRRRCLVKEMHGRIPARSGGALPCLTTRGDQTKNQVVLLVSTPTKPYQDRCPPCETDWGIWSGAGALTNRYHMTDLAGPPSSCTFTNHYRPRG